MNRRPRVLLTFLGWAGGIAGGDRHLLEMAARWKHAFEVEVIAPGEALGLVHEFLGDVRFHKLGRAQSREAARGAWLAIEYTRRSLLAVSGRIPPADVIVSASHFAADAIALRAGCRQGALGVGYVYHLIAERSGWDARTAWSRTEEELGIRLLAKHAGLIFTSNGSTSDRLRSRGIRAVRTDVGIDVGAFAPAEPTTARRAVFIARLVRSKGVGDVVRAWQSVLKEVPEARLVIVGEGPERERAHALADRLGIGSSIDWPGFVSEARKREYLASARVFVSASYEEGWGIAVCEALASGLPVVAYTLPTLDELFRGAFVGVPVGDVDRLAAGIVTALTDDELVYRLRPVARQTAERYDLDRVADAELTEILQALSERQ